MAVEFRGCKNLVFAEVTKDDETGYTTGTVESLAPVGEIAKTVEFSSATHFYDNKGLVIIDAEGIDTVTFTISVPDPATFAKLTGRTYDSAKKMFIESKRKQKYFAVGYIIGEIGEGEDERFVWRLKGTFNLPDESSKTEDNGTDASNLSLVYTGVFTEHEFENGQGTGVKGSAKANFIRKSDNVTTASAYFAQVVTPDTTLVVSG